MAVGSTDMAGMTGDVYPPTVEESPEPPATLLLAPVADPRFKPIAAPMAAIPDSAASDLIRATFMRTSPLEVDRLLSRRVDTRHCDDDARGGCTLPISTSLLTHAIWD